MGQIVHGPQLCIRVFVYLYLCIWVSRWWDAGLVCNHTRVVQGPHLYLFICVFVFVYLGDGGDGMQGWFAITHGSCTARGHTCCSGLTEVPCLMSTSSIPNASDCHLSDAHHLLFIYWGCTNCFMPKTALSSKHCYVFKKCMSATLSKLLKSEKPLSLVQ